MTVKELYEWALHRGVENLELVYDNGSFREASPTIVTIEHFDWKEEPVIKLDCD